MGRRRGLPDYLCPGLTAVFVGINPGLRSAEVGHHFAGYANRFWKLLVEAALVPEGTGFEDDWRLPEWGLGLTNLVPRATSGVRDLTRRDFQLGRRRLLRNMRRYRPATIALVGVSVYEAVFPHAKGRRARAEFGRRFGLCEQTVDGIPVFLLPNPSGRNAQYSYAEMLRAYRRLQCYLANPTRMDG